MKKIIITEAVLLHQLIRKMIYKTNYIDAIYSMKSAIYESVDISAFKIHASVKQIKSILNCIVKQDEQQQLVSSCISITLLAYLLCNFANIDCNIVIGVKMENGKLLSHSWLELTSNKVINYFTNYKEFRIIKKFKLEEI